MSKKDEIRDETPWSVQEQCPECGQIMSAHMDGVAFCSLLRDILAEIDTPLQHGSEMLLSQRMVWRIRHMLAATPESTGGA